MQSQTAHMRVLFYISSSVCQHLTAGFGDYGVEALVEKGFGEEVFESEVHTVAPVVARFCGDVNLLFVGVVAAETPVDGKPVLQWKDA